MKIRFLTTIPFGAHAFHLGQVIDVAKPTADMLAWLKPLPDGTRRAEVVTDQEPDLATVPAATEQAVTRGKKTKRADA